MRRSHSFRLAAILGCALAFTACAADDPSSSDDDTEDDVVDPPNDTATLFTPTGVVDRSCIQEIEEDATIDDDGVVTRADGTMYTVPSCDHDTMPNRLKIGEIDDRTEGDPASENVVIDAVTPTVNGWVEAAWWSAPRWMRKMHGHFVVPWAPSNKSSQTIFFFPAFEPHSGTKILQPVLQWGPSAAGGGKYWTIASWYVAPGRTVHGPLRRVSVGDQLYGSIEGSSCSSHGVCTWTVVTNDSKRARKSTIHVKSSSAFTEVQGGVLEAYNVNHCNKFPAGGIEAFFDLRVYDGKLARVTPRFSKIFWSRTCHESQAVFPERVFLAWH